MSTNAIAIPDVAFINNANQRTPCVLILDGSGSMDGGPINALNAGLESLAQSLAADTVARERVRLKVLRVGDQDEVEVLQDWVDAIDFQAPQVVANGTTPLGGALSMALDSIEEEKRAMKASGITYTRPLIWMITDGQPTDQDSWNNAVARCSAAISAKQVALFAIGTEGADISVLSQVTGAVVLKLQGTNFKELFAFLSASVASASKAAPGMAAQVALPPSLMTIPV